MKQGKKIKYLIFRIFTSICVIFFSFDCIHAAIVTSPPSPFPVDPPLVHPVIPAASPSKLPGANFEKGFHSIIPPPQLIYHLY